MDIKAVIFDFDGVVRHWDGDATALEAAHGLPAGAIHGAAFEPSLLERALTGRISDETWRLALRNALVRAHGEGAAPAADAWSARHGRIDPDAVALVAAVRGLPRRVALLSNATTRLETDLQAARLDQAFDVVVNSARVGFAKPDPRIFHVAAARLGFVPGACVFIDDTPAHVAAAASAGMAAITFTGLAALRDQLRALGLAV